MLYKPSCAGVEGGPFSLDNVRLGGHGSQLKTHLVPRYTGKELCGEFQLVGNIPNWLSENHSLQVSVLAHTSA